MASSILKILFLMVVAVAFTGGVATLKHDQLLGVKRIKMNGAVGPESMAFDPNGGGPYTGVADGRILRWDRSTNSWAQFAVTSATRKGCSRPENLEMEHICGRPLGLRFHPKTGDLYIGDAYFGLEVVGPSGGIAKQLVTQVNGQHLVLTNDLDIDEEQNIVYFSDSSTKFERREYLESFISVEKTGKLMKYNISSKEVTVLLQDLAYANGVSLSKDRSFILVAESTASKITRFWLKGPRTGESETFAKLPGLPDNIRRNADGDFWVGLVLRKAILKDWDNYTSNSQATVVKLNNGGKILKILEDQGGKKLSFVAEVVERNGKLWIGSAVMPFVGVYDLKN